MTKEQEKLRYWLALSLIPASTKKILGWIASVNELQLLFTVPARQLMHIGVPIEVGEHLNNPPWARVTEYLMWKDESTDHHIITYDDPYYPKLLKEIPDPPLVLFVKGDVDLLDSPQLAIVGSRNPSPSGIDIAKLFAKHLAQMGITITSGLALGIDGAAHEGAIAAENGRTIAVLGTGVDVIYPASHQELADKIIENGGTLVSEFPPHTKPKPYNFPRRNRIISGLSLGTLVVEAALRSGSLITARCSLDQGREVFAVPGSIHNPLAKGCHMLIRNGAKLVETANDIIEELGPLANIQQEFVYTPPVERDIDQFIADDKSYQILLEHIDVTATPVDILSERTNLPISEISSMLLVLELKGYVESAPSGYIKKRQTV